MHSTTPLHSALHYVLSNIHARTRTHARTHQKLSQEEFVVAYLLQESWIIQTDEHCIRRFLWSWIRILRHSEPIVNVVSPAFSNWTWHIESSFKCFLRCSLESLNSFLWRHLCWDVSRVLSLSSRQWSFMCRVFFLLNQCFRSVWSLWRRSFHLSLILFTFSVGGCEAMRLEITFCS